MPHTSMKLHLLCTVLAQYYWMPQSFNSLTTAYFVYLLLTLVACVNTVLWGVITLQ